MQMNADQDRILHRTHVVEDSRKVGHNPWR